MSAKLFKRAIGGARHSFVVMLLLGRGAVAFANPGLGEPLQDNLYGVSFVSANVGWAVGAFGSVYHTADAGLSWTTQQTPTLEQLFDVDFVDDKRGWIVGRSGTILHTDDGGASWGKQRAVEPKHLFAVDFVDASFGVAVGDWGVILVTEDGGRTWQKRDLPRDVILNGVSMVNRSTGFVAGEMGTILRTDDAGVTWNDLASGVDKTFFGLNCSSIEQCWVVGIDGLLLRSQDGGASWQVLNGETEMRSLEQVGFGQAYDNPSLYAVAVVGHFGVAVGEIGAIYLSEDDGASWQRLEASKNWALPWFRDVALTKSRSGAIVGAKGQRIQIVDGQIAVAGEE